MMNLNAADTRQPSCIKARTRARDNDSEMGLSTCEQKGAGKEPRRFLPWAAFLSFAAFILSVIWVMDTGRGQLVQSLVGSYPYTDKLGHFLLMGTLCLLLNLALKGPSVRIWNRQVLKGSAWLGVVIVFEELSQLLVSYRTFDLADLCADFVGILMAGVMARRIMAASRGRLRARASAQQRA